MARFSERYGYVEPRSVIQTDDLDQQTRNALWDAVYLFPLAQPREGHSPKASRYRVCQFLWQFWHQPQSSLENAYVSDLSNRAHGDMARGDFHEVMDLLEFFIDHASDEYPDVVNNIFKKYLVGWRVVGGQIVPVTETPEVEAIEEALQATTPFSGARSHLQNALALLADRSNPNYAKVVHESISAVEAIARHYTGDQTLGGALKKLEASGVPAHGALTKAWGQLFGYTSDGNGIRHGSVEDGDVDEALATYFLVTCSAFVGYLIKKGGERGEES